MIALIALWAQLAWAPADDWEAAQQAEQRSLESEREVLRERLEQTRASTQATRAGLTREIEALREQLAGLQIRGAALEGDLPAREANRSRRAQTRSMDDLVARIEGLAGADPGEQALPQLIDTLLARARTAGQLRLEPDAELFEVNGHATRAAILRVGNVAALRADGSGEPLAMSPQGMRALQGEFEPPRAHGDASVVDAVLFDPSDPPAPQAFARSGLQAKMDAGGPVMWVLALIGAFAGSIALERALGLLWAGMRWRSEQRRFAEAVRDARASSMLHVRGWIAKPLVIASSARCPSCSIALDVDVEERARQALMVMRERLQQRLSLVSVAAGVSPLLGLLGTVTGMIHTFAVVTESGTSEPQQLAAGISEALLTTQLGLTIAIPAYLAHALLSRGARRILASAEQTVLAYLHGGDGPGPNHQPNATESG